MPELNASPQGQESIYLAALRAWGADAQMNQCAEIASEMQARLQAALDASENALFARVRVTCVE